MELVQSPSFSKKNNKEKHINEMSQQICLDARWTHHISTFCHRNWLKRYLRFVFPPWYFFRLKSVSSRNFMYLYRNIDSCECSVYSCTMMIFLQNLHIDLFRANTYLFFYFEVTTIGVIFYDTPSHSIKYWSLPSDKIRLPVKASIMHSFQFLLDMCEILLLPFMAKFSPFPMRFTTPPK